MVNVIDWESLESRWFKPTPEREYIVEFENWRTEESTFGRQDLPPRVVLCLDVVSISSADDGVESMKEYRPPKQFSTLNSTFVEGIRPIIERAIKNGEKNIYVQLKKSTKGVYNIFSFTPLRGQKRQYR